LLIWSDKPAIIGLCPNYSNFK